jgi:metal-responsive CopG/Arc/MetJ family transcriptional regulator
MKKVSVSLASEHVNLLDERQEADDITSRSAALRDILDEYETLHTEYEDLRTECEDLRTRLESREERIDELEGQLAKRSHVEEKVDVLAKRVEDTTYYDRRQRALDRATVTQRLKWKLTGVPASAIERGDV